VFNHKDFYIYNLIDFDELDRGIMKEMSLNNSINWIEALFNYATIGIIISNRNGLIIDFNHQAEIDFGYLKSEVINKPLEILLPANIKKHHIEYRELFYKNPSPRAMGHNRDLYAQRKDGSIFPVEVSLSNYTINDELFVISFMINITVRKEQEKVVLEQKAKLERITMEVRQLNADLELIVDERTRMLRETLSVLEQSKSELSETLKAEKDLSDLKSKFLSMASHEFKTPLSTILSSAFLLEKYNQINEPVKSEKHIHRIKNAVIDMKMILDDFLSVDKLEDDNILAKITKIPAQVCFEEVRAVVQDMQVNCKNGQTILFQCKGEGVVSVDEQLLKNICINLISNAIKFSREGSIITVSCELRTEELIVSFMDHGIGIPHEDQGHLFERFFRAGNAINIQGTGLGLHIVASYVTLLNGEIEFKSELDKGSLFIVRIPQ